MKIRTLVIVAAAFIVTAVATPSFAMYHAGMGRFMQRDPHGTMNAPTAPRIAWVQLGLIGKWGEHHTPSPTPEIQNVLGDAFSEAFPDKHVTVRHPWEFTDYQFGIYWDSWAHMYQVYPHGHGIERLGDGTRWQTQPIGGEVAYNWGAYKVQPGDRWCKTMQVYHDAPQTYTASGTLRLPENLDHGQYVLALAILDPAGMRPSARFAIENYFTGGRHPIGRIGVGVAVGDPQLDPASFDDPAADDSLRYEAERP